MEEIKIKCYYCSKELDYDDAEEFFINDKKNGSRNNTYYECVSKKVCKINTLIKGYIHLAI